MALPIASIIRSLSKPGRDCSRATKLVRRLRLRHHATGLARLARESLLLLRRSESETQRP